jgi:hypothetical protein
MQNFFQDLRFSARTLRKSPGFALTAILTLALGIGAVTSIFSVVDSVLLKPFAFASPDRLVMLHEYLPDLASSPLPDNPNHFLNWQNQTKTFSGLCIINNSNSSISVGTDHPELVSGLSVEPNFFDVLGVHPFLGRGFRPGEGAKGNDKVVVLSWNAWQRYFHGDPQCHRPDPSRRRRTANCHRRSAPGIRFSARQRNVHQRLAERGSGL